jgi:hypothetical protein
MISWISPFAGAAVSSACAAADIVNASAEPASKDLKTIV